MLLRSHRSDRIRTCIIYSTVNGSRQGVQCLVRDQTKMENAVTYNSRIRTLPQNLGEHVDQKIYCACPNVEKNAFTESRSLATTRMKECGLIEELCM